MYSIILPWVMGIGLRVTSYGLRVASLKKEAILFKTRNLQFRYKRDNSQYTPACNCLNHIMFAQDLCHNRQFPDKSGFTLRSNPGNGITAALRPACPGWVSI
jgi:hypothetical protein